MPSRCQASTLTPGGHISSGSPRKTQSTHVWVSAAETGIHLPRALVYFCVPQTCSLSTPSHGLGDQALWWPWLEQKGLGSRSPSPWGSSTLGRSVSQGASTWFHRLRSFIIPRGSPCSPTPGFAGSPGSESEWPADASHRVDGRKTLLLGTVDEEETQSE